MNFVPLSTMDPLMYSYVPSNRKTAKAKTTEVHCSIRLHYVRPFNFYRPRTKYEGRYSFHRCLSVHTCPIPRSGRGVPHSQVWIGGTPIPGLVPHPRSRRGYPHPRSGWGRLSHSGLDWVPPISRQSSIESTCYVAGGMPLAFTQEDFLVEYVLSFCCFEILEFFLNNTNLAFLTFLYKTDEGF